MPISLISVCVFGVCALATLAYTVWVRRRTKDQINAMTEILADVKCGNGNRRILAKPGDLTSPLAYELNGIIQSYETQLSTFRKSAEWNRQLMTSLSHDVRTPLTTLIGYLDALQKGIPNAAEQAQYLEAARRKASDLKETIDALFDWFKLNSDEFTMEMKQTEIAS